MNKKHSLALHIFRRDLRLEDNTALIHALCSSNQVIPCFIFDKRQIENNDYKSQNAIEFMLHSLQELNAHLKTKNSKLYFFYGIAEAVIETLLTKLPIDAVFFNRDYTPFSRQRDQKIQLICEKNNVSCYSYADALLHEPEESLKKNQTPYTIFSHYFKHVATFAVKKPEKNNDHHYYSQPIEGENNHFFEQHLKMENPFLFVKGGRKEALKLLSHSKSLVDYEHSRNYPAIAGTTRLSAHHKFGTLSIREVYDFITSTFGSNHSLIRELYWRDFFTTIAYYFPFVFGKSFQKKYQHIKWQQHEGHFKAWCEGKTGFPLVDAGMRELNTTGYMHNRVRMLCASFLTKDLHLDWQLGEKYFATKLVDYDPAINNGNWQWAASTGCDAQPYFRVFNPWIQQKKFDPECKYIKHWIPELNSFSAHHIHQLNNHTIVKPSRYPSPIVNHAHESQKAKSYFLITT